MLVIVSLLVLLLGFLAVVSWTGTLISRNLACLPAVLPDSHQGRVRTIHRLVIWSVIAGASTTAEGIVIGLMIGKVI